MPTPVSVLRLLGIAAAAFVVVIMLFASVARVDSGNVECSRCSGE
jgi:hypothetical protein